MNISEMLQSLCVVEGKLYKSGQDFTQGCNSCTCWGHDEFTCSPTDECSEGNVPPGNLKPQTILNNLKQLTPGT